MSIYPPHRERSSKLDLPLEGNSVVEILRGRLALGLVHKHCFSEERRLLGKEVTAGESSFSLSKLLSLSLITPVLLSQHQGFKAKEGQYANWEEFCSCEVTLTPGVTLSSGKLQPRHLLIGWEESG